MKVEMPNLMEPKYHPNRSAYKSTTATIAKPEGYYRSYASIPKPDLVPVYTSPNNLTGTAMPGPSYPPIQSQRYTDPNHSQKQRPFPAVSDPPTVSKEYFDQEYDRRQTPSHFAFDNVQTNTEGYITKLDNQYRKLATKSPSSLENYVDKPKQTPSATSIDTPNAPKDYFDDDYTMALIKPSTVPDNRRPDSSSRVTKIEWAPLPAKPQFLKSPFKYTSYSVHGAVGIESILKSIIERFTPSPTHLELNELASWTSQNPKTFHQTMRFMASQLYGMDRKQLKCLVLLLHCLARGSEWVVTWIKAQLSLLQKMHLENQRKFKFPDRATAKMVLNSIITLVQDDKRLLTLRSDKSWQLPMQYLDGIWYLPSGP
jgi:ENTH domain